MKINNQVMTILSFIVVVGAMWAVVPVIAVLLGDRPPWHDLRVMTLGWVVGFLLSAAFIWSVRRIMGRGRA